MGRYIGSKVLIVKGRHEGQEGYVEYEDSDALAIKACGYFGAEGYYGFYYARKENVIITGPRSAQIDAEYRA